MRELKERRDNRGRVLLNGEDQMPDGRYQGTDGRRRAVYSWRLEPADPDMPEKQKKPSLREIESDLAFEMQAELQSASGEDSPGCPTLNRIFSRYLDARPELRPTTRENYIYIYEAYVAPNLGGRKVDTLLYSDLRSFYIKAATIGIRMRARKTGQLCQSRPIRVSSLGMIHGIIHASLELAVRDGILQRNPSEGLMSEVKRAMRQPKPRRHAFTEPQQISFIEYLVSSPRYASWMPLITVFLGTGCRVGELIGLRWEDIDFDRNLISVNHSLVYRKLGEERCRMHVTTPKTQSGIRTIPMLREVREALLREKNRQAKQGGCISVIDGYRGFVFINRRRAVHNPSDLNRMFERMRCNYNKKEQENAARESREAVLLPHFSAHNLRHTFCTRFCENETNVKMIQSIMGHADISTTMNIYAEATEEKKRQTMENLEGKMRIS